jgi:hypothetical protein
MLLPHKLDCGSDLSVDLGVDGIAELDQDGAVTCGQYFHILHKTFPFIVLI